MVLFQKHFIIIIARKIQSNSGPQGETKGRLMFMIDFSHLTKIIMIRHLGKTKDHKLLILNKPMVKFQKYQSL